ncbi:restriction endonuclease subunit S [Microvirga sp. 2MCAF35]|uniref:restriction endonuclease subunit S n=1 Tax=Microvirga sp. 2MCAF35 TaxID=3232987 RepID=UPI003F9E2A65
MNVPVHQSLQLTANGQNMGSPSSWPRVRLGDVAEHRLGKMLDKAKNTGLPRRYLRNPNIKWFEVELTDLQEIRVEEHEVEKYRLRRGDVLICEGGEAGRAAIWDMDDNDIIFQKAIHRVRVGDKLDSRFLVHRLMYDYFTGGLEDYYTGATIKHFTGQDLAKYELPLPPIVEQRRIAALLDQADALRRKRKETMRKLQELRSSFFMDLFGDPSTNPKGWPIKTISDLADSTQYGTSAKAGEIGEFPILRMGNITYSGEMNLSDLKYITLSPKEFEKYTVRDGDILFNRTNSPELVGKTAVFRGSKPYAFAGYLVRLRTNQKADPEYISAFLNSSYGKATLQGMCKSIIGMANINAKELCSIRIPIPPLALQQQFAKRVSKLSALSVHHHTHLQQLDALFASLQHRAFRGEL